MSLNQNFTVKNSINTLGNFLSGGVDIATLFIQSNGSAGGGTGSGKVVFDTSPTISNLTVTGQLNVQGTITYLDQENLLVSNSIIYLNQANNGNSNDIGVVADYVGVNGYGHSGLLRDHTSSDGSTAYNWYLFSSMTTEPSANTVGANTKIKDTLVANLNGNASTATILSSSRNFTASGDVITDSAQSFDGSASVTLPLTIGDNKVTYGKFQKVAANKVLGNSTSSSANVSEISVTTVGFSLLGATDAAAGAGTLNLGATNDVTHKSLIVSNSTQTSKTQVFNGTSTNNASLTVTTFPNATYNTAKYVAQIKQTNGANSGSRACVEIIVTNNNGTWTGTYYGIVDASGIFSNVDIQTSGSTIDLVFTLVGANSFSVNVVGQALTD